VCACVCVYVCVCVRACVCVCERERARERVRVYARTYVCVWERIHDRPVEARCFHNKSVLAIARHVTNAPFQVVLCPQLHLPHLWLEFIEHLHMHPYTCLCSHVRMRHTYHVTRAQHVLSDFTLIAACKRYTLAGATLSGARGKQRGFSPRAASRPLERNRAREHSGKRGVS